MSKYGQKAKTATATMPNLRLQSGCALVSVFTIYTKQSVQGGLIEMDLVLQEFVHKSKYCQLRIKSLP